MIYNTCNFLIVSMYFLHVKLIYAKTKHAKNDYFPSLAKFKMQDVPPLALPIVIKEAPPWRHTNKISHEPLWLSSRVCFFFPHFNCSQIGNQKNLIVASVATNNIYIYTFLLFSLIHAIFHLKCTIFHPHLMNVSKKKWHTWRRY